ncbi:RDD family protein [Streptomyces litchfieldiae]|uniref:RDD family protein n=1 Tax=Streptomyces litchfieldiae TaxID=3075543 RepID=A0ABU2N1F4_9ACTN|nr:RDD family protein [Streptomyces sp. DSM 44938]MDT0347581.1 RDD family protein [Streptomyces sp. DSM 44938]
MTVVQEADEGRLVLATATDVLLTLGIGFVGARALAVEDLDFLGYLLPFVGCALAFSFVNHVFGMWLCRASVGKLLWGLRVVRVRDGGRPGFWRAVGRWLVGYVLLVLMMMVEDGGGVGEACGLRTVRRRDLRRYSYH